ncbi:DNA methylase N-4/N-6 [Rhizobium sp. VS19-DR104.2]|uniref:DNA methyltransferase n=1 Tax=unclassified Rhizobium TaxID=2613769 RepID=UPI001CC36C85|nr:MULTISPECIES: DNA methyltransferase [unclassified Rhizobium]MBZ5763045.1 DNA methylase N-4/N-6 [Rhizobium sp. VS19-DR96]MBZ5768824.1 DNA methylase N-4/N-6 [Rhizobium sp. VS19-DR129.2]MBZ5776353.1 DNA methylase N-4/N-6 [Rhizobium sp. VS19-DRK62.2]MBZ5787561.1 DNA methylase N-4/N-6 [Rhizobium sp. VS19-DR121]MBZ5804916.1 DNA methylase N-4/N-6 [Rhizobium sp. VS19-DR181]
MRDLNNKQRKPATAVPEASLNALYRRPLAANRSGALYSAFPYPTKISPDAIALYIAAHTRPGDTVFDGFGGSGTTGLAALLCERPSDVLRAEAKRLGLDVEWGARNAVLYELGALGAFVGRTLTNPPDPVVFRKAAEDVLAAAEEHDGWMYEARDPRGAKGSIRHMIWSDSLRCPGCRKTVSLWDACVSLDPAEISPTFSCPKCSRVCALDEAERITENEADDVLGEERELRHRTPARVYGSTGGKRWSRAPHASDIALIEKIAAEPLPSCVPNALIPWGDLYRKGYHLGVSHVHHFYTRRNLIVFARMWKRAQSYKGALREGLLFWLLSYNASHGTIMTRVVAKTGQKDLVVTSAQPGVLYISGLPVEKNLFAGLKRKLSTISQAFELIHGSSGKVDVIHGSSCNVDLQSGSIDYVFTDPPFGANIPYAELNFINEAWLETFTDRTDEAIVSPKQEKSVDSYRELLTRSFGEARRILKSTGQATMVFHSASAEIWNALQRAYQDAGFDVEHAGVLNKTQGSFKQVTAKGAVSGDPVLLLGPRRHREEVRISENVWSVAAALHSEAFSGRDPAESTAPRLYSRFVNYFLSRQQQVPLDADVFYRWFAEQSTRGVLVSAGE